MSYIRISARGAIELHTGFYQGHSFAVLYSFEQFLCGTAIPLNETEGYKTFSAISIHFGKR